MSFYDDFYTYIVERRERRRRIRGCIRSLGSYAGATLVLHLWHPSGWVAYATILPLVIAFYAPLWWLTRHWGRP